MKSAASTSKATNSLFNFEESSLVTVRVGRQPLQKTFVVHEDIISRSEYFRCAMNGNWAESDNRVVSLLDDDPHIFSIYLHMVHTNRFPNPTTLRDISTEDLFLHFIRGNFVQLANLYVLAEKLQDTATKNTIITEIMTNSKARGPDGHKYCPGPTAINIIYKGTLKDNLCRLLVTHMCTKLSPNAIIGDLESLPREFLFDLAFVFRDEYEWSVDGQNLANMNGIEYYLE